MCEEALDEDLIMSLFFGNINNVRTRFICINYFELFFIYYIKNKLYFNEGVLLIINYQDKIFLKLNKALIKLLIFNKFLVNALQACNKIICV